ncbi:Predicted dithiol-disulfide isomerase, DsbA family [Sphingobacterium nematocida]|uniref:Predicted dithiol-disulfide isomerase, DsbA family n=1 Tax=Sphingobacterium nematocida TaxID=1513896 RepID=A0A1T5E1N3_9SPHI|nr:DsbA family oxidoreductase [Sphingobacterium nematocida]SKB77888.1 Predicted dithiol-disulfide isomerase, DsbA family [Sphingobacterium nematocida]
MEQMKIEIWSDIMCPFCYIGKRKLEKSLETLPNKDRIEIEWKSYQLNPDLQTDTTISINDYLAKHKGMSIEQARQLNKQVTEMAAIEGLEYNMDKSVVANSFRAHMFAHYAKKQGKQLEAEELLFQSYFTDGKNVDDLETLKELAIKLELDKDDMAAALERGDFEDEVKMDIHEARQIGVKGVPFFVYDRKYAISGAQPQELFEQTLIKALSEWSDNNTIQLVADQNAPSCGPQGCD